MGHCVFPAGVLNLRSLRLKKIHLVLLALLSCHGSSRVIASASLVGFLDQPPNLAQRASNPLRPRPPDWDAEQKLKTEYDSENVLKSQLLVGSSSAAPTSSSRQGRLPAPLTAWS